MVDRDPLGFNMTSVVDFPVLTKGYGISFRLGEVSIAHDRCMAILSGIKVPRVSQFSIFINR